MKRKVKAELEIKVEDGETRAVNVDEVVVQKDDVGVKLEADLQDGGKVEMQALGGAEDNVKLELTAD